MMEKIYMVSYYHHIPYETCEGYICITSNKIKAFNAYKNMLYNSTPDCDYNDVTYCIYVINDGEAEYGDYFENGLKRRTLIKTTHRPHPK